MTRFPKFISRNLLRLIDSFLPVERPFSRETLLRYRLAISYIVFDLVYTVLPLFAWLFRDPSMSLPETLQWLGIVFTDVTSLFLIKKSVPIKRVVLVYLSLAAVIYLSGGIPLTMAQLLPWMIIVIPYMLFGFLLSSDRQMRIFVLISAFVQNLVNLALAIRLGFAFHEASFTVIDEDYLVFAIGIALVEGAAFVYFFLKLRSLAQKELDLELDWQLRSSRLSEISSLTNTIRMLMSQPLRALQRDWDALRLNKSGGNSAIFGDMSENLNELIQISQSFAWINRAYRKDEECSASSPLLFQHLNILISLRAEESGWTIDPSPPQQSVEFIGSVPTIMLLLFSIIVQIFDTQEPLERRVLSVSLQQEQGFLWWKLSWPFANLRANFGNKDWLLKRSESDPESVRMEMIQELIKECEAKVEEYEEQGFHHLAIGGTWGRPSMVKESRA